MLVTSLNTRPFFFVFLSSFAEMAMASLLRAAASRRGRAKLALTRCSRKFFGKIDVVEKLSF